MNRRTVLALAAIAAAALCFRIWVVADVATREPDGGDPLYYHAQANLLADGKGFAEPFLWLEAQRVQPSAVHPPGFSMWLAISSFLGQRSVFAHKVMSALAGALTVLAVGWLAVRLAGPRAGVASAVLAALHPNLWVIDGALMPEALYGLAVALVLLAAYRATSVPRAAILGAAIGVAALIRSEALLFVPLLGIWIAARRSVPKVPERLLRLAAVGGVAVAVLAPWTVRNLRTFDAPVVLSANGDEVLRNANCDRTWTGPLIGFWSVECYEPVPPAGFDEAERAAFWRRAGVAYVRAHADRLPGVLAARVGRVWEVYRPAQDVDLSAVEGRNHRVAAAGQVLYYLLLPAAGVGAVVLRRKRVPLWPLGSTAVVVTATAMYAYGTTRFRMPAEIALVVLAGCAVELRRRPQDASGGR